MMTLFASITDHVVAGIGPPADFLMRLGSIKVESTEAWITHKLHLDLLH